MLACETCHAADPDFGKTLAALVEEIKAKGDRDPDSPNVLTLAREHGLTIYDAAYLELALRLALPLATLDRALANAASATGVELLSG